MTDLQAIEWLHARKRLGTEKDPHTMPRLSALLGNPQDRLSFVHVVGTNGKGSVTEMISRILTEAGYRTGRFLSPYVETFGERFAVDGRPLPDGMLGNKAEQAKNAADKLEKQGLYATEFELITAIGFLCFAECGCDLVCLEAGIGGRNDATNIIKTTKIACITRVGLDHMELLGGTPAEIALNKCGILKPGCIAVSYPGQLPEVDAVIREQCKKAGVKLRQPEAEDARQQWEDLSGNHVDYGGYSVCLSLHGRYQANNCAMAVEAAFGLCELGYEIHDEAILAGLEKASLPAREEVISLHPPVLLDGAHNPDSAEALRSLLLSSKIAPLTGIIGILQGKDTETVLRTLEPCFDIVYTAAPHTPRAQDANAMARLASGHFRSVLAFGSLSEAIDLAVKRNRGFVVCGSFYLAGEARSLLRGVPGMMIR